jgi:hypothetical protein
MLRLSQLWEHSYLVQSSSPAGAACPWSGCSQLQYTATGGSLSSNTHIFILYYTKLLIQCCIFVHHVSEVGTLVRTSKPLQYTRTYESVAEVRTQKKLQICRLRTFKLDFRTFAPDSYPKIFSNLVTNSPRYSNSKFD